MAQGILPMHRYHVQKGPLDDLADIDASFGLSLRQLAADYTGFAVRVRRNSDNALADVSFDLDNQGMVTLTSTATLVSNGSTTSLSAFKGSADLFVRIWYNQSGDPNFNAIQNTNSRQPQLTFNTAGASNDKPSILFNGNWWLEIQQGVQNVLDGGIRGSFILWTKPTRNKQQFSFGARFNNEWRWSFHINWTDGRVYFDAAERCCATNRWFANGVNLNQYNSYTFIRGTTYKTVRVNSSNTTLNNSFAASQGRNNGEFWIGWNWPGNSGRYEGNLTEVMMFRTDISQDDALTVEQNQKLFWQ